MNRFSDAMAKARAERYNTAHYSDAYVKTLEEDINIRKNFNNNDDDDDDSEYSPMLDKSITYSIEDDEKDDIIDETVLHNLQQELEDLS
jgi:hypothetical protein